MLDLSEQTYQASYQEPNKWSKVSSQTNTSLEKWRANQTFLEVIGGNPDPLMGGRGFNIE
jgi:hypothetical protein